MASSLEIFRAKHAAKVSALSAPRNGVESARHVAGLIEEARGLLGEVVLVLGSRSMSGPEMAVYRRACRLLDELE